MGLPLGYLAWLRYRKRLFLQWKFWVFGAVIFLALFLWYYHAHRIYLQSGLTFGVWEYQTDKWGKWWLLATPNYWVTIFGNYIGVILFAGVGYPIFIVGLFLKRKTQQEYFLDFWLASILVYFLVVNQGNLWHFYYQLPFAFPAAWFMGKVFGRYFMAANIKQAVVLAGALALLICSSVFVYDIILMAKENPETSRNYELAGLIQANTKLGSLIVVLDDGDPTILYLAKRRGWHGFIKTNLSQGLNLEQKTLQGAQYFAGDFIFCSYANKVNCDDLNEIIERYPAVLINEKFFIVELSE